MRTNAIWTTVTAALFATATAGAAAASTVNVTYQTPGSPFGTQNLQQSLTVSSQGYNGPVRAGAFQLHGDNGFGNFTAFCIDIYQALQDNTAYQTTTTLFNASIVDNLDRLFTSVYASVDTALEAAAFQVSVWEIVEDTGSASFDLDGGAFSMSGNAAVETLAGTYLSGLGSASTGGYSLTFLDNDQTQDIVTASPVPLPASLLLFLGGLGGLGALRSRKSA